MLDEKDKVCLAWGTFSTHIKSMLSELMTSQMFADVTLITDDKKHLKAHRNVLSGSSPVFKHIFNIDVQNKHPIVYLKGIQKCELEAVLQFIYLGEAVSSSNRMNEFFSAAESLGIISEVEVGQNANKLEQRSRNNPITLGIISEAKKASGQEDNKAEHKNENITLSMISKVMKSKGHLIEDVTLIERRQQNRALESNENNEQIQCPECSKVFVSTHYMIKHFQGYHDSVMQYNAYNQVVHKTEKVKYDETNKTYCCQQCDAQYATHKDAIIHVKSEHEDVNYQCNDCSYYGPTKSKLRRHVRAIHEGVKLQCKQCDKQFSKSSDMQAHVNSKHKGIIYPCKLCGKIFSDISTLNTHLRTMFSCDHCEYQISCSKKLSEHFENMHAEKYQCKYCKEVFSMQESLEDHIKSMICLDNL